jgi:hypothetical protein
VASVAGDCDVAFEKRHALLLRTAFSHGQIGSRWYGHPTTTRTTVLGKRI